ncbi:hypothetical protein ABFS83_14G179100 [Erythranthe nasuta]
MDNSSAQPSTSTTKTAVSKFYSVGSYIFSLIPFSGLNRSPDQQKIDEGEKAKEIEKSEVEELTRKLQAEKEALMMQQLVTSEDRRKAEGRIRPSANNVLMYEDSHRQEAARNSVPVGELEEKAKAALAQEGNLNPAKDEIDHAFLVQLLSWFKHSFRWVDAPPCDSCKYSTSFHGVAFPNRSESLYKASQVELYRCNECSKVTRFPRYNDPVKLVETRKGRCGEWANCFTLYCRSFGFETRMILDFTDHLWTECYSPYLKRWVHLDPCEGVFDNPLLYENGWGKKLTYVIALARDGVYDVTKRYTRKWNEVLTRRVITTEPALASVIADITSERRKNFDSEMLLKLDERDKSEAQEFERNLLA